MDSMKRLTIVWGIVMFIIFCSLTAFGFFYKAKTSVYKELEEKLKMAEQKYVNDYFLFPKGKDVLKTHKEELIENGYLDNLNLEDEECDGYVTVTDTGTIFNYKAYIKCNTYTTNGYKKNSDN